MSISEKIKTAVSTVNDQRSFLSDLLGRTLGWPTSGISKIDEIAYSWTESDLDASGLERHLVEGSVWQLQPTDVHQAWGIFVLDFTSEESLSPRRGMAGVLRKVLRGLVAHQRKKSTLPSWRQEHLLFICTYKWTHFKFAYFRSSSEHPTIARLSTFGWEPGSKNRTLTEFNLPALVWPEDPLDAERWVNQWANAFNKEPLTREFFRRFEAALEAIKRDLEHYQPSSPAEAYTHAQLLLERLIFLYFLQNRGWLNRRRSYLKEELAKHADPDAFTYYHNFLDRLFWTISTPPGSPSRFDGIPFLNGGLFDDDQFSQPADLRKVAPPLNVRNATMDKVFSELLEEFNFTVTEDTPLSQEVAVDPEMLGKVFESIVLHAEEDDPDAHAPDKRKSTGSYYTPRIVVHFICREALLRHLSSRLPGAEWHTRLRNLLSVNMSDDLDQDELKRIRAIISPEQAHQVLEIVVLLKCCDPAVGSGAFPVGLMQELVGLRRVLETVANGRDPVLTGGQKWLQAAKSNVVENCLFGVDIQRQAIEICRLRLWLSLVVDYDLGVDPFNCDRRQFKQAIDAISQLPNLEMNFRRGDSLHDYICGVPVRLSLQSSSAYADALAKIARLGHELHHAPRGLRRRELRVSILKTRLLLATRIVEDNKERLQTEEDAGIGLFGAIESATERHRQVQEQIAALNIAAKKISQYSADLAKLQRRYEYDNAEFNAKLRELEGSDFDSEFDFVWRIDFPDVFRSEDAGFHIIVGNPPFVTARNPIKRELWRSRWPLVAFKEYQLLAPFFALGFSLLTSGGQLGYIVSNAFAKRDFGKPLVERLLAGVSVQEIIDCSGLSFPGHGTPTCIILAANRTPSGSETIRNVTILPGGGDLRTPPEDSTLWHSIERNHSAISSATSTLNEWGYSPVYEDFHIAVGDCARAEMLKHPCRWCFVEWRTFEHLSAAAGTHLRSRLKKDIGRVLATSANDIYVVPLHTCRMAGLLPYVRALFEGEYIRNWSSREPQLLITPYDASWKLLPLEKHEPLARWFGPFRHMLEERKDFGGGTYKEVGRPWYEFHQLDTEKLEREDAVPATLIAFPFVATHGHFACFSDSVLFHQSAPVIRLATPTYEEAAHITALINSSTPLFWFKQLAYNKGAGIKEERDRFEFTGTLVDEFPLPLAAFKEPFRHRLVQLATQCIGLGNQLEDKAALSLFRSLNDTYPELPFYRRSPSKPQTASAFKHPNTLRDLFSKNQQEAELLRKKMIALQEEMDWVTYAAYGILKPDDPAGAIQQSPEPLNREYRPFSLWEKSEGDYQSAIAAIPQDWNQERHELWLARITAIRDNEHVRRIEQPVYKRRWDEQWKISRFWRCGSVAYAAEFVDAFEWWVKEKAEWWIQTHRNGGPVEFELWKDVIWADEAVQAAWVVAADSYGFLAHDKKRAKAEEDGLTVPTPKRPRNSAADFCRWFRELIDQETVPDGFDFGIDYEQLAKKNNKVLPSSLLQVRGKLNVPRERFHSVGKTQYKWAGLQFRAVKGTCQRSGR